MFRLSINFLFVFLLTISTYSFGQNKLNGHYVGLLRISEWTDEKGNKRHYGDDFGDKAEWYHECSLTIKGDSVWFEKNPISIKNGHKFYSASDGAFYYYSGKLTNYKGKTFINLILKNCDYCPILTKTSIKFTPPKIIVEDTTSTKTNLIDTTVNDTTQTNLEEKEEELYDPAIKYKTYAIELTKNKNILLDRKHIFRRQKRK
jgi:hypothetical protein